MLLKNAATSGLRQQGWWLASRRAVLAVALGACLTACDWSQWNPLHPPSTGHFNAIDVTGANYAQDFSLPDATGQVRRLVDFKGKVTVVFFGFTQCPDVCPTTLGELAVVKQQLGAQADQLAVVFITLDPERDSAAMLDEYVKAMNPSFVSLRGTPEQTAQLARSFKIFYEKVPSPSGEGYTIDHTAGAYVFDKQGKVRLFVRYGMSAEKVTADVRKLLAES